MDQFVKHFVVWIKSKALSWIKNHIKNWSTFILDQLILPFWPKLCIRTLTSPLAMNPLSSWSFNLNNSLILSTVNCSSKFTFFLWNILIIISKLIRFFWPSKAYPRLSVSNHDVWTISFYLDLDRDQRWCCSSTSQRIFCDSGIKSMIRPTP